jgi:hypothetical protein
MQEKGFEHQFNIKKVYVPPVSLERMMPYNNVLFTLTP